MPPTLADRVFHILECINDIERVLANVTFEEFVQNRMLRFGMERALEIISEASRHLPADVKSRETAIEWRRIADFGNQLRHAYHQVDAAIVWRIAKGDLPSLKAFAERVIQNEKP